MCSHALPGILGLAPELCGLVEDAFDLAAVDVEFAGDGALAMARLLPCANGLFQRWCS
jgi:hypothetical protein